MARSRYLAICFLFICLLSTNILAQPKKGKPGKRKPPTKRLPTAERANIKIAKVNPQWTEQMKASAAKIDVLVEANYQQFNVTPNPMTTDSQFVRRVYLDITGAIPTYKQAKDFLSSHHPNKRSMLIDELLNSVGYASHFYNYWANILRLMDRPEPNIIGEPYNEWVKRAVRDNKPYDKMVYEMLTAEGKIWDNPPVGYTLRDNGMPLDAMNNTVRVFLGTRIGCAQCHNHPFDRWTQREFYEMAAYSYGVTTRLSRRDPAFKKGNPQRRLRSEVEKLGVSNRERGMFLRLVRANMYVVKNQSFRRLKFPHDYSYKDHKPGELVTANVIFSPEAPITKDNVPREVFARWLTSKQNPRFAGTIANRLWGKVMGVAQINPVDDIIDSSQPENRALMVRLISEIKRMNFNLKEYLRILYNTKTYQRQASIKEIVAGELYHFPGPILRRMTAEQAWDSLLTLAVYDPDAFIRPTVKDMGKVIDLDLANVTAQQVLKKAKQYDQKYGRQAMSELRKKYGYKGQLLARASEMPQPLPADHFLRQFGQGDRELIEGATTEGTVPQILTMFNGPVTHMMLERGSVIFDNVVEAKSVNERIDVIFLSLLCRKPMASDRSIALRELREGAAGYGNVIWSLLNTREFLFVQ